MPQEQAGYWDQCLSWLTGLLQLIGPLHISEGPPHLHGPVQSSQFHGLPGSPVLRIWKPALHCSWWAGLPESECPPEYPHLAPLCLRTLASQTSWLGCPDCGQSWRYHAPDPPHSRVNSPRPSAPARRTLAPSVFVLLWVTAKWGDCVWFRDTAGVEPRWPWQAPPSGGHTSSPLHLRTTALTEISLGGQGGKLWSHENTTEEKEWGADLRMGNDFPGKEKLIQGKTWLNKTLKLLYTQKSQNKRQAGLRGRVFHTLNTFFHLCLLTSMLPFCWKH